MPITPSWDSVHLVKGLIGVRAACIQLIKGLTKDAKEFRWIGRDAQGKMGEMCGGSGSAPGLPSAGTSASLTPPNLLSCGDCVEAFLVGVVSYITDHCTVPQPPFVSLIVTVGAEQCQLLVMTLSFLNPSRSTFEPANM